jgi:NADH-quinone oxidoreductase subunit C
MSDAPDTTAVADSPLDTFAEDLTQRLGALGHIVEFGTVRILVDRDAWVETILQANRELPFFSWLSAIDWSRETEVGEGVDDPDEVEERFEVICRLSSVETADAAQFVASLPKEDPTIGSLAPHIGGASWHEREAHEMFGIMFEGNDHLIPLYLPDDFEGNPLLKSYPLISREVKPWPGDVDVEGMPETSDEADDTPGEDEEDAE